MGGGFEHFTQPNLDITAKITIAFNVAVLGGKHSVSYNNQSFDIKIPKGTKNGEKLRVRGKGKSYNNQTGDLFLKVEIAPSPEYERDGDNLTKNINIPLKTALFGGKIKVQTLYKEITLKVGKDTKVGQRFRVKELGVTNRKSGEKGDLYLKANLILPKVDELDDKLSQLMKDKLPE